MERFEIQTAFTFLKPRCDAMIKNPNVENVRKITETVTTISDKIIEDLGEYVLFPFTVHLQNNQLSITVKEEIIKAMDIIISKAKIRKINCFKNIYASLLIQIYDKSQPTLVIVGHEELKEAVLSCIKTLIHSCFTEVIESLYTKEESQKIGQGILLSITIARFEKSRSLRLTAINTVMALCQIDENVDTSDITLQNQVADIIMLYLPGIASGLQEVAMGNEIQGHKLTVMALKAWGRLISLVMGDEPLETVQPSLHDLIKTHNTKLNEQNLLLESPFLPKNRHDLDTFLKEAVRSPQWFKAAAMKLNVLVQELNVLKKHSHYKVRVELAQCINLVLTKCSRNMMPNINLLIEYLISLSEDDVPDVSEEAMKALNAVSQNYLQSTNMRPLVELLEENFYNLLTKLPRIIRTSNDNEQLSCLNEVAGYLNLLGEQRSYILQSTSHIQKLLFALVHVTEIDNANISLLHVVNVKDLDDPTYVYGPHFWRRFKFIQNKACEDKLITICTLIGKLGDIRILTDFITTLISDAPQYRKELILLLTWIINVSKRTTFVNVYIDIAEFFMTNELWHPPMEVTENVSLRTAQNNVIQCCLLMEGLSLLVKNISHDCKKLLSKIVYEIMEKAGSENSLISFIAAHTLEEIAVTCGYETVGNLLQAITDYLSYSLLLRLRRVRYDPGVLNVITAVMKYSSMDVFPCMRHLLQLVFNHLKSDIRKENAHAYIKIFYTFAICVKKIAKCKDINFIKEEEKIVESQSSQVIQALLKYYEAKRVDKTMDANNDDDNTAEVELNAQTKYDDIKYCGKVQEKTTNHSNQAMINDKVQFVEVDPETNECKITEVDRENINTSSPFEEGEEIVKLPPYVQPIEDVAKHCLNLIPSKEVKTSLIAMATLIECITIIAQWEDRLLPLVHLIWSPLVEKFRKMDKFHEENVIVMNHGWQLLNVLARVSQDFIRSRTLKEIVPSLSEFLNDSAKESYKKGSQSIYRFTQVYKLQKELLSTLGRIATDLKLHEQQLWNIITITEPYLNKYQNPVLQNCCIQLYKDIADYNEDIIWVKCLSIWHSKVCKIPCDATFNINNLKVPEDAHDDYHKNVLTILDYILKKNEKRNG